MLGAIAFLISETRSGPIDVPDRLSCSRGKGCATTTTAQKISKISFYTEQQFLLNPPL
jgi:hypothetical protein